MTGLKTVSFVFGIALLAAAPAWSADLGIPAMPPQGVACGDTIVASFPSVWEGHFSGGRSTYPGPGASIQLDWHDGLRCFPTERSCDHSIRVMRRHFHQPEGYSSCIPIR